MGMENNIIVNSTRFAIGDRVKHDLFNYRGVILDVDASFQHSEEWYSQQATSMPSKDQPWYQVLVHGTAQMTYVAEQNLTRDFSSDEIEHPAVEVCFDIDTQGHYHRRVSIQ